jgi:hypothetical protein
VRTQQRQVTSMEAGLETRFDGNPLHFRILTGYAGLCRQQCPLRGRGWGAELSVVGEGLRMCGSGVW